MFIHMHPLMHQSVRDSSSEASEQAAKVSPTALVDENLMGAIEKGQTFISSDMKLRRCRSPDRGKLNREGGQGLGPNVFF